MKRILLRFSACVMVLFFSSAVFGGLDDFTGTWKNVDPSTQGITTLKIQADGPEVKVQIWGKCPTKDCDWGEIPAEAYGPSASSNVQASAVALTVRYSTDFSKVILVIRPAGADKLKTEAYTQFRDNSGRSNYTAEYKFKRVRIQAAVPGRGSMPVQPIPPAEPGAED